MSFRTKQPENTVSISSERLSLRRQFIRALDHSLGSLGLEKVFTPEEFCTIVSLERGTAYIIEYSDEEFLKKVQHACEKKFPEHKATIYRLLSKYIE